MRDKLVSTAKYATKRELLVLYLILFVGLSLLNWNLFAPLFGLFAGISRPVAVAIRGIFGFLTAILGFVLTVVAFVGILKTAVEDTIDGHRLVVAHDESSDTVGDEDETTEEDDADDAEETTEGDDADETAQKDDEDDADEDDMDEETEPAVDAAEDGQAADTK